MSPARRRQARTKESAAMLPGRRPSAAARSVAVALGREGRRRAPRPPRFPQEAEPNDEASLLFQRLNLILSATGAALLLVAPRQAALGAIAALLVLAGAGVALHAWRRARQSPQEPAKASARRGLSLFDVAGAYVFFGCLATGLADPDAIARLF
jgi:hypothetical protein